MSPRSSPRPDSDCDSAPSVVARSCGCTACSSGTRLSSTRSTSRAASLRSCGMTSPAAIGAPAGPLGRTSETYFSPNSVLGISRAETPAGIWSTMSGSSESCTVAPPASALTASTRPTLSPRTLTSARSVSWLPTRSICSVTGTPSEKAPTYLPTASPSSVTMTSTNASPWSLFVDHPATLTEVEVPYMTSVRKKSRIAVLTIDSRTERPTAMPTPAGPPLAE